MNRKSASGPSAEPPFEPWTAPDPGFFESQRPVSPADPGGSPQDDALAFPQGHLQPQPVRYPTRADNRPARTRAAFSRMAFGLESHHAGSVTDSAAQRRARRRKTDDDSLRLIDDLTNRPLDPMFSDAQLARRPQSRLSIWASHAIVFLICVVVGFSGFLFVRQLHADPRKEVRDALISQLNQVNDEVAALSGDAKSLHSQVDEQSKKLGTFGDDQTKIEDDLVNGASNISGEGITLTLADPIAANTGSGSGSNPREGQGARIRVITDTDLQQLVSLMWRSGAEAIAINGHRLGVRTSIRLAGQTILVGIDQIESPYRIQAIGSANTLAQALGAKAQPKLYDSFKESGIYPQISKADSMTLESADTGDVTYARRSD